MSSTIVANGRTFHHTVIAPNKPVNPEYEVNEICLITDAPLPQDAVVFVSIQLGQELARTVNWSFKTSATGAFDPIAAQGQIGTATPVITIIRGSNTVMLFWTKRGMLQSANTVAGPWTDIPGTSPFSTFSSDGVALYRVKQ